MREANMIMEPDTFEQEITTMWSFPNRGEWATHDWRYRGNWSPRVPRNLILKYSAEGDTVLDQFVGGGTTLVEAKLLKRHCIGVDINEGAVNRCNQKVNFVCSGEAKTKVVIGDARKLDWIPDNCIDLICMHPPYADIIKYSKDANGDISLLNYGEFLEAMRDVAKESYRVLKSGKKCTFMIGDTRRKGKVIPMGFSVMQLFQNQGFQLNEIIIKEQHNCKSSDYWDSRIREFNFLLLAHEYIFVLEK